MNSQESPKKAFGSQIREAREKIGLTQAEAAEKAGINSNYFAMIERGEVNPSFDKIKSIIKVLKLKITLS